MKSGFMVSELLLPVCVFAIAQTTQAKPAPVGFNIAVRPEWVKPAATNVANEQSDSGGIAYLLVDRQENLELGESYYHEVRKITSENGVQNGASITTSFDPSYESLTIHSIQLFRNGVNSNRLERSKIKLLQREKDMERRQRPRGRPWRGRARSSGTRARLARKRHRTVRRVPQRGRRHRLRLHHPRRQSRKGWQVRRNLSNPVELPDADIFSSTDLFLPAKPPFSGTKWPD